MARKDRKQSAEQTRGRPLEAQPRGADRPPAQGAARRARRLPLPRQGRRGALRRQGAVDPQADRLALLRRRPPADRRIERIEFLVTANEAEALLTEQNFIKRHRPRFNIRLRDDKSYPYVGVSLDQDYPRVYFTRERHRANRAYFGPFSSAKRVRETLDLLGKLFQYRTCEGAEPGRRSGNPCLDYYIKRCGAPCVGYVDREEYRRNIDAIVDFLSGRYRQVERDEEAKMTAAARPTTTSGPPSTATGCGRSGRCSSASRSPAARSAPPT